MITLSLPIPPSTNRIWRSTQHRVYRSKEYMNWLTAAGLLAAKQLRGHKTIQGEFKAEITIDREQLRKGSDLANREKSLLDACQSWGVIADDKNLIELRMSWGVAPAGCILTIKEAAA